MDALSARNLESLEMHKPLKLPSLLFGGWKTRLRTALASRLHYGKSYCKSGHAPRNRATCAAGILEGSE